MYKEGPQTTQESHILSVYKDPDFLGDIDSIFPTDRAVMVSQYEIRPPDYSPTLVGKKKHRYTGHKTFLEYLSLANMQQADELRKFVSTIADRDVSDVAEKYSIRPADVWFYLYGRANGERVYREQSHPYTYYEDPYGNPFIKIDLEITKEDFMQLWKQLSKEKAAKHKGKIPKNKLPEYNELLYAIFKARRKGTSFGEIFSLYSAKKLPYYSKLVSSIDSEQKLKDYYYKFGPKVN